MKVMKMYLKIQELKALGFSQRYATRVLHMGRDTIRKYWNMTLDEYKKLEDSIRKASSLNKYESIILSWLNKYPDMTAAQIYDWLLEHYAIQISERSVSRYVSSLRFEHHITKVSKPREYEAMDELPMGYQIQVDFGQKALRTPGGQYQKVHFVAFVLSHSRFKWGYFLDRPFTSTDLVQAMDMCFGYLGGIPHELVFDQDSIVSVNENYGDIIYTYEFEKYRQAKNLNIYLCRKADPESKGKIENVVRYVKYNFLENRLFMGIDILNQSFEEWLVRTGNGKVHNTTKKVPAQVFELERPHLRQLPSQDSTIFEDSINRKVRKDNTIIYEGNRYSLPLGTYTKEDSVKLEVIEGMLIISQLTGDYVITEHVVCSGKGRLIKKSDHRRNKEHGIDEWFAILSNQLDGLCDTFLSEIRRTKIRYIRDQYGLISKLIKDEGVSEVIQGVAYCERQALYSATALRDAIEFLKQPRLDSTEPEAPAQLKVISNPEIIRITTQKRDLNEYAALTGGVSNG